MGKKNLMCLCAKKEKINMQNIKEQIRMKNIKEKIQR